MFQHTLRKNLSRPVIELIGSREKASSEKLHSSLIVSIGNLVRCSNLTPRDPLRQIKKLLVSGAKDVNYAFHTRFARTEFQQIVAIVKCEYVECSMKSLADRCRAEVDLGKYMAPCSRSFFVRMAPRISPFFFPDDHDMAT